MQDRLAVDVATTVVVAAVATLVLCVESGTPRGLPSAVLKALWLYAVPQFFQVLITRIVASHTERVVRAIVMVAAWVACATIQQLLGGFGDFSAAELRDTAVYWAGLMVVAPLGAVRLVSVALLSRQT